MLRRQQGNRPVTLIGTSLGAKLIYECLLYMNRSRAKASKNERSKYLGIIENVILIGAPISPDRDQLEVMSTFVSGKIVNAYCKNDWVLGVLLRAMGRPWGIAGLAPIANDGLEKIVNVDLSDIVNGHRGYKDPEVMKLVLDRIVCEI